MKRYSVTQILGFLLYSLALGWSAFVTAGFLHMALATGNPNYVIASAIIMAVFLLWQGYEARE